MLNKKTLSLCLVGVMLAAPAFAESIPSLPTPPAVETAQEAHKEMREKMRHEHEEMKKEKEEFHEKMKERHEKMREHREEMKEKHHEMKEKHKGMREEFRKKHPKPHHNGEEGKMGGDAPPPPAPTEN